MGLHYRRVARAAVRHGSRKGQVGIEWFGEFLTPSWPFLLMQQFMQSDQDIFDHAFQEWYDVHHPTKRLLL